MTGPVVSIDLEKIERNARAIVTLCQKHQIEVTGVTKVTCGMPPVARAMLRGGVASIGESRIENIHRLRASGIHCPIMLLRIPPLSEVDTIVASANISLNSELAVIQSLSEAAVRRNLVHEIILMVDLGDLREGIWPDDLVPLVREVVHLPGVRIVGLGTNLTCYGGVIPTQENMQELVEYTRMLESSFGLRLRYLSGGNSSSLPLLASGHMPNAINHLRIGEAIILGRETIHRQPWPGTVQDACLLTAELIELKKKPTIPVGMTSEDAFGGKPHFEDLGERIRGILNVGREDIHVEGLRPVTHNVSIFGASSDHLLVDVTEVTPPPELGDRLEFQMNYAALLAAMTSEYVKKHLRLAKQTMESITHVHILGEHRLETCIEHTGLPGKFASIGYTVSTAYIQDRDMIAQQVEHALTERHIPLILDTVHQINLAGLEGIARHLEAFGLIRFDARARFLPFEQTWFQEDNKLISGHATGDDHLPVLTSITAHLSPENVVLIGLREANPEEADLLTQSRFTIFTMEDVDALGMREIMHRSLRAASFGTQGIYVSYRPDVTDIRGLAESAGGLTYRETHQAMEMIAASGLLRAMDVTGITPEQDSRVTEHIAEFVLSCFGKKILGR